MPCTVACLGYVSCIILMSLAQVPMATLAWCSCPLLRNPWCFLHWRIACWWPWHNRGVNRHQKTPQSRRRCPSASWPRLSCAGAQGTRFWGGKILWDPSSWFQAMWKILVTLDHLPRYWWKYAKIKKCLKPPPNYEILSWIVIASGGLSAGWLQSMM